jgi:hypothetical protein
MVHASISGTTFATSFSAISRFNPLALDDKWSLFCKILLPGIVLGCANLATLQAHFANLGTEQSVSPHLACLPEQMLDFARHGLPHIS